MNFLVSANHETVLQFQAAMAEKGELEWLVSFSDFMAHDNLAKAGLLVIDAGLHDFPGIEAIASLKAKNSGLVILLAGKKLAPDQELAALASGAMGCCDPQLGEDQIRRILSIVEEGGVWISNHALPDLLKRLHSRADALQQEASAAEPQAARKSAADVLPELTQREQEIAHMVAAGDSNKAIARKLDISDRTVKSHLTTIFQKLHLHDRLQLALYVNKGSS